LAILAIRQHTSHKKAPDSYPSGAFASCSAEADYFLLGGKSVQDPCATSAAMPMLSPSVGWGLLARGALTGRLGLMDEIQFTQYNEINYSME
jgi:hypothetical protein